MDNDGVEKLAQALADRLALPCVPDLPALAAQLGLRIQYVAADGFEGALVRALDQQKGIIAMNSRTREAARRRFTIAHEIGHFLIPRHRLLKNVCRPEDIESWHSRTAAPEQEANRFAIELLLSRRCVSERLDLGNPSLRTIGRVANEFNTSLTATTRRFLDLTDAACAMVWIAGRRAKWCVRSDALGISLPLEELPAPGSLASRIIAGESVPDDLAEVPVESWVQRGDKGRVRRVLEHSLHFKNYGAVFSFLEFVLDSENAGSEDEAQFESLDPHHFDNRLRIRH